MRMLALSDARDAVGLTFESLVVEDYRFLMDAGWDLLAGEDFLPLKLKRVDGTLFEAELRVRNAPGARGIYLIEARDTSKIVRAAEGVREREERLQAILHSVAEGIVTFSEAGTIESANPAVEQMFGYGSGQLSGRPFADLLPAEGREEQGTLLDDLLSGRFPQMMGRTVEGAGRRADDRAFPVEVSITEFRHGRQRLFTAILRDISERKEHEAHIRRLAHHDSLTGLPNRNLLDDRITHAAARVRRHGGRMAVLYVDLDKFKPINDTYGHEAGDLVLREVSLRLSTCIRASDTVARVGGNEFVVVIEEIVLAD
ncbi:MAG: diguanylate cyclase, partial [Magnetospirillum sp.]|nr:diguanylate cyclase [Magnetospirillum sp.]